MNRRQWSGTIQSLVWVIDRLAPRRHLIVAFGPPEIEWMNKNLLLKALPVFLFISIGICGRIATQLTRTRYALIVNTWNDFKEGKDVDAFPAQALQAYYVLKSMGYQDGQVCLMVYHLNDSFIDGNLDGVNDMHDAVIDFENDLVSKSNLRHALENLSRQVRQYDEVMIYLVGHGNVTDGELIALSFENHEFITETEFSDWLDMIRCDRMPVFLDFCYSGEFGKSVAAPGRTVVCSSGDKKESWYYWNWGLNSTEKAIFGNSGSAFFHPLWKKMGEGATLQEAFRYAKEQCYRWGLIDPNSASTTQAQDPQMYVEERGILDDFMLFYPGGLVGLIAVAAIALVVELIFLFHSPKKQQSSTPHRHRENKDKQEKAYQVFNALTVDSNPFLPESRRIHINLGSEPVLPRANCSLVLSSSSLVLASWWTGIDVKIVSMRSALVTKE